MSDLHQRAEAAHSRFESESAKLLREDGQRRFSDKEHGERSAALKGELRRTLDSIEASVDDEISRGEATLARYADRSALLSTEELTAANARRTFVAEDAENLPLEELAERLEAEVETLEDALEATS